MTGVAIQNGKSNTNVAGYFASFDSPPSDVGFLSSVVISDSYNSSPLFTGRTNGGLVVAILGASGVWTNMGTLYSSNAVPLIPTASELGLGGHQTMNSNGFLVDIYTLDGSTTVMKVLAP